MNAEQLKNSILQRAIEGKLVEQRPEEGTAAELLREIKVEKARLVKEGKLKKEKPLRSITAEEIPFEIPESWEWVRFGEIANTVSARRVHQSDWKSKGVPFYRAREIAILADNNYVDNELYISEELYNDLSQSGIPKPNDLMITAVGTLGKTYIVKENDKFYYKDASVISLQNYGDLCAEYLKAFIESPCMRTQINSNSSGTTVATLTIIRMNHYLIPLPPLAEQKRIVAKIEELLPHIEQYGKAHDELTALNTKFPEAMKKSVLQYAMEGKLVEQRAEEGTAKELLKEIKAEKARLVKEGKLKKEKPLRSITAEEIPFEIPESWEWVRLGEICFPFRYGTSEKSSKTGRVPVLRMGNIQHGSIDYSDLVYTNNEEDIEKYQLNCNDLLFNRTNSREWVGKTALYRGERPAIFAGYLIQVTPFFVDSEYLNYVMNSEHERNYCKRVKSDGINQSNVNAQKLSKFPVPLPPLAEQKRIVAKIEELLSCCGALGNESTA